MAFDDTFGGFGERYLLSLTFGWFYYLTEHLSRLRFLYIVCEVNTMGRQWYSYRDDLARPTRPVLLSFRSAK